MTAFQHLLDDKDATTMTWKNCSSKLTEQSLETKRDFVDGVLLFSFFQNISKNQPVVSEGRDGCSI
jgi:hypothetical protein